jgi:hypothetical protein
LLFDAHKTPEASGCVGFVLAFLAALIFVRDQHGCYRFYPSDKGNATQLKDRSLWSRLGNTSNASQPTQHTALRAIDSHTPLAVNRMVIAWRPAGTGIPRKATFVV